MSVEKVEMSFKISDMIAKEKKLHNIGVTLITPCMLKAAGRVLGEIYGKKMLKISLLYSMIKTHIDELTKDIEFKFWKSYKPYYFFAIQCDETTDITQLSQMLV